MDSAPQRLEIGCDAAQRHFQQIAHAQSMCTKHMAGHGSLLLISKPCKICVPQAKPAVLQPLVHYCHEVEQRISQVQWLPVTGRAQWSKVTANNWF